MAQTANKATWNQLSEDQQRRYAETLRTLREQKLPCRCEEHGHELHIVVAPGMSSAVYWMDRFDIDD